MGIRSKGLEELEFQGCGIGGFENLRGSPRFWIKNQSHDGSASHHLITHSCLGIDIVFSFFLE